MAIFKTTKTFSGPHYLIPKIAEKIQEEFIREGYTLTSEKLDTGGYDISITKGGFFKKILGMDTALKIKLQPAVDRRILFEAGVGIFGKVVIPAIIAYSVFWPVLITQLWGLIQQSNLDDKAAEIVEKVIAENL